MTLTIAVSLATAGCGSVRFKPETPPAVPHAAESSNLTVGLISESSEIDGNFGVYTGFVPIPRSEIASTLATNLAEGLRQTEAFKDVQYPLPKGLGAKALGANGIDLVFSARLALQFVADPWWVGKAVLTGATLFLAEPMIPSKDRYDAKADLVIKDAQHREIGRYSETIRVDMSHLMITAWGARDMIQKGADIAIASLTAKLAEDILRDLGQLKQAVTKSVADTLPVVRTTETAGQQVAAKPHSDVDDVPAGSSIPRKGHAVVIGIEHYRQQSIPAAEFAADDAQLVGKYITKTLGFPEENVTVLIDGQASKGDFEKYFESWLPNRVENGDEVFIYYSGHGAPNPATGDAYLVPYDGDPTYLDKTAYPVKRMYQELAKLPASNVTVVLDSCFSGGGRSVIAAGARPLVNIAHMRVPAKVTVLAAASSNEISNTYQTRGHGLFTYFFLKGLKAYGDNFKAVFDYLKPEVSRVARREYNTNQAPVFISGVP